uniref:Uncharacterized protein n=1 Tax=Arundo donax TaxID=35708 RepID=A0A0A9GUB2_ARUDO
MAALLLYPLAIGAVSPAASMGHGWCSVENAEISTFSFVFTFFIYPSLFLTSFLGPLSTNR